MGNGPPGVTGDLVANRMEEELDQEKEVATPHHHRETVEIVLARCRCSYFGAASFARGSYSGCGRGFCNLKFNISY